MKHWLNACDIAASDELKKTRTFGASSDKQGKGSIFLC
jgi:hypothetical protein